MNLATLGREIARDQAVFLIVFMTWVPLVLGSSLLLSWLPSLGRFVLLYWLAVLGAGVAAYWGHYRLLIRKRIGLRFLERYDSFEFAEQMWIQALTIVALVLYLIACGNLFMSVDRARPVHVVVERI